MAEKKEFKTFPECKGQGLAMYYLQSTGYVAKTPTELAEKFDEVFNEIKAYFHSKE